MDIALKRKEKATYNYTNRHRIKQKFCHVEIVGWDKGQMHLKLYLDPDELNIQDNQFLVLEALYRGIYFRKKIFQPRSVNELYTSDFSKDSNPSFRVKLLPEDDEEGKIISATKLFKAKR